MTSLDTPTFAAISDAEEVGSYETIHGASLAAAELQRAGFTDDDVRILPVGVRPLAGWSSRVSRRLHPLTAVLAGLLGFSLAGMVLFPRISTPAVAWFASLVAGAACAGAALLVDSHWAAAVRERARADRRVLASRFEVRCRRDASRARHVLARWWNPAAVPAKDPR